jgi:solute carrier family 35 protein E1
MLADHQLSSTALFGSGGAAEPKSLAETIKVGTYFALWYTFNIGYNIYNKKALNACPMPYTLASAQLFIGLPYAISLFALKLRKAPKLDTEGVKSYLPIALCNLGTHLGAVVSLGAGAVSFTHIVKASEPVVSAALTGVVLGQVFHPMVYASLIPIIGGVGLASLSELSFTWLAFGAAMVSNVSSAMRAILGKIAMGEPKGENMDAPNTFFVLTLLSALICLPVGLLFENPAAISAALKTAGGFQGELLKNTILSGIFFYLYNEVAFLALDSVAPVTHAVGNTIKRVVIILASVVVFKNPITGMGKAGSAIAIAGTLLYSLAKGKFS